MICSPSKYKLDDQIKEDEKDRACMWEKSNAYGEHLEDIRVCNRIYYKAC